MADVYLFGMTVLSSIHKLAGTFPEPDGYAEIAESHRVPGGETMNAAIVLSNLGLSTQIGGPRFGTETERALRRYAERYAIDVSSVTTDLEYAGVQDLALVDDRHRTVFGSFGRYFGGPTRRWDEPDPAGIAAARVVSIDPFFGASSEEAAALAAASAKPYVTIDCPFDGSLHLGAAVTVISREFRRQHYRGFEESALFEEYRKARGLTIFTAGREAIRYGRSRQEARSFEPFRVDVVSTLGAGDVFRAGVVYAVFRGLQDDDVVAFASALAAVACRRMPIAEHPPELDEVEAMLGRKVYERA